MKKVLAACYHDQYLALVVLAGGSLYDWRRHRLPAKAKPKVGSLIAQLAANYGITDVVVDPRQRIRLPRGIVPRHLSLADAKDRLLPDHIRPTHSMVIQQLVQRNRWMQPLATIAPVTGRVSMTKPWQTAILLSCVLALAHHAQTGEHGQSLFNNH